MKKNGHKSKDILPTKSRILLYQTEDGRQRIEVRLQDETVWLSLKQMAELFQRDKSVVSRHINNVFKEGELLRDSVVANFATTAADEKNYQVEHFNLDDFLRLGERDILTDAGKISHEEAVAIARAEYDRYRDARLNDPSPVEKDFLKAVKKIKRLRAGKKGKKKPS